MNAEENLALDGLRLAVDKLAYEVSLQRQNETAASKYGGLPEWINLEQAAALKGGPALVTYRQKLFLQPCCGLNWKLVGGRRCWKKKDVIEWLGVTDASLKQYAGERNVRLPELYERRSD
jgi:hypothetical protein